jgi:Tfp pilus assembly protein PilN
MIKVNLLQKKSATALTTMTGASPASGLQGILEKFRALTPFKKGLGGETRLTKNTRLKGQEASKKLITVLVLYGVCSYLAYDYLEKIKAEKLQEVQLEIDQFQIEITALDKEIGKKANYESLKKQYEADEKSVRTKIEVVKKLLDERPTISKLLLALSQATPKDVWISSFQWQDTSITINGNSIGTVVVTDFVKNLEETIFFKDVNLKSMRQTKDKGLDIASFELEARKK